MSAAATLFNWVEMEALMGTFPPLILALQLSYREGVHNLLEGLQDMIPQIQSLLQLEVLE